MALYYAWTKTPRDDDKAAAWFAKAAGQGQKNAKSAWGLFEFLRGNFPASAALSKEASAGDTTPAILLWRYLSAARAGNTGKAVEELRSARAQGQVASPSWKEKILDFHAGKIDSAEFMRLAQQTDRQELTKSCDANFHIAQAHLIAQRPDLARPLLEAMRTTCIPTDFQLKISNAELARTPAQ
ncbi:MAG: hypothetical protein ABIT83_26680 [Massilia sp.]